ncbi:hypothetical protein MILUP08_42080 [Micromonospora lupini str. Lupac 08]|uniref:Uncharacterized protein n=1 Tax=Micromonospora lupini str. Lupac 08 TaxID=1150864 RepID=I0L013_9ACTN|nr:hypothetical protein MILUP08_42080 [Micromonospora lupini str. Lupac 08]
MAGWPNACTAEHPAPRDAPAPRDTPAPQDAPAPRDAPYRPNDVCPCPWDGEGHTFALSSNQRAVPARRLL